MAPADFKIFNVQYQKTITEERRLDAEERRSLMPLLALSHHSAEHAIKSKPIAELTKYEESH